MNMVTTKTYANAELDVVLNPDNLFQIGVIVANTGVSANADGKKIIPAGTPVGSATNVLETRNTVLTVTNSAEDGAKSQGVLRHDVDVTNGNASATMVVRGEIDLSKCPTLNATAKTALVHLIFVNGGSY